MAVKKKEIKKHDVTTVSQSFKIIDWEKIKVICLLFLSFSVLLFIFNLTRDILVPFVIAVFIYYAMAPLVNWFQHSMRIPRMISLLLTFFSALLVATLIILLVITSFSGVISSLDQYQNKLIEFTSTVIDFINSLLAPAGIVVDSTTIIDYYRKLPFLSWAKSVSTGIVGFFGKTILVVLFFIFLIAGTKLKRKIIEHPESMSYKINDKIAKYLATKFLVSIATGALTALVLFIMGVDFALLFGLLAFLLNFIPSIGSIIAVLLPLPVALMQFGPSWQLFLTLIIPGSIQFTIGNLIEPRLMGESLGLHPVVVLLSLLLWGFLWGIPGMLMAVPMTAILKIILERYELTNPFARILAGHIYH